MNWCSCAYPKSNPWILVRITRPTHHKRYMTPGTTSHQTTPHHITSHHTTPHHITSRITLHHVSHHTTSHHITPHHALHLSTHAPLDGRPHVDVFHVHQHSGTDVGREDTVHVHSAIHPCTNPSIHPSIHPSTHSLTHTTMHPPPYTHTPHIHASIHPLNKT